MKEKKKCIEINNISVWTYLYVKCAKFRFPPSYKAQRSVWSTAGGTIHG